MKLEERFREECTIVDGVGIIDAKQCVSITDEQMIKFAYWIIDKNDKPNGEFTIPQLLEIYKRINNL